MATARAADQAVSTSRACSCLRCALSPARRLTLLRPPHLMWSPCRTASTGVERRRPGVRAAGELPAGAAVQVGAAAARAAHRARLGRRYVRHARLIRDGAHRVAGHRLHGHHRHHHLKRLKRQPRRREILRRGWRHVHAVLQPIQQLLLVRTPASLPAPNAHARLPATACAALVGACVACGDAC